MAYASQFGRGYLTGFNSPNFTGTPTFANGLTVSSGTVDVSAATLTGISGRWQLGPIMAINLAANQTDSTSTSYTTGLGAALRVWKAQRACSVTGISYYLNTVNGTPAGTVTVSVFKNGSDAGSDYDLALTPSGASDQGPASKTYSTALTLADEDTIDLRWTTTADWNSTTGDIVIFLEMEQAAA